MLHQRGVITTDCIMFLLEVTLHAHIKKIRQKDPWVIIKCSIIILIIFNYNTQKLISYTFYLKTFNLCTFEKVKLNVSIFLMAAFSYFFYINIKSTCFTVGLWIHDDELRPEFTDASSFENWHQPS